MITYTTVPVMTATPVLLTRHELVIDKVQRLENELLKGPQVELPITHHFVPRTREGSGMYAREMFIPAGTVLTGAVHKFPQINIISQGEISVLTEKGLKRLKAGAHLVTPSGVKRAGYAHSDTIWTTIIATDHSDTETIENQLTTRSYPQYLAYVAQLEGK